MQAKTIAHPETVDAAGHVIDYGGRVTEGPLGADGTVVEFVEPDMSHWRIGVEWDDVPGEIEYFDAVPSRWEGTPLSANDVELVPSTQGSEA